jgi:hypothetical protein
MLKSDPFLLSAAEIATTETMRADGTIPQDWRYIDIPWQHAAIFDKIVEIGGADLRVLDSSQRDEKKRGRIVLGPKGSKRINERAFEIRVLFKTAAYKANAHAAACEKAA